MLENLNSVPVPIYVDGNTKVFKTKDYLECIVKSNEKDADTLINYVDTKSEDGNTSSLAVKVLFSEINNIMGWGFEIEEGEKYEETEVYPYIDLIEVFCPYDDDGDDDDDYDYDDDYDDDDDDDDDDYDDDDDDDDQDYDDEELEPITPERFQMILKKCSWKPVHYVFTVNE